MTRERSYLDRGLVLARIEAAYRECDPHRDDTHAAIVALYARIYALPTITLADPPEGVGSVTRELGPES